MKKRGLSVLIAGGVILISLMVVSMTNLKQVLSQSAAKVKLENPNSGSYPWDIGSDTLKNRLYAMGLPALTSEGTILHSHQHLDIYINGSHITVPGGIGISETAGIISPIHTHDDTGIIHIESPVQAEYTLGQFFDIWGVFFNDSCLGKYCTDGMNRLNVYVNGKKSVSNFRAITLEPYEEIVIIYINNQETPKNIPSTYHFPPNY